VWVKLVDDVKTLANYPWTGHRVLPGKQKYEGVIDVKSNYEKIHVKKKWTIFSRFAIRDYRII
jgi:hypothetical protein